MNTIESAIPAKQASIQLAAVSADIKNRALSKD
jgi:hypothetical protein